MMRRRLRKLVLMTAAALCVVLLFVPAAFATSIQNPNIDFPQGNPGNTPGTGAPLVAAIGAGSVLAGAGVMLWRRSGR